jgi:teichuronic acid exporter
LNYFQRFFYQIFNKVKKNKFYLDIGTLASGSIFGQLIILIATPVITRIYSPNDFGVYAIYVAFSTILAVFTSGRFEFALAIPKSKTESENILKLIFALGLFVSTIYLIIVLAFLTFSNSETHYYNYFIENFLFLIPLSALIVSVNTGLVYMVQRKKMYKTASLNIVLQNITIVIINLIIGIFVSIKWGLVSGLIAGQLCSISFLFFKLNYDISIFKINYSSILLTAKKYINFPKFKLISDLAGISSQQLTPIAFSFLFNNFIVGNFSLANRFLRLPAIVLTSSIENVFRNDAIEEIRNNENCKLIYVYTLKRLFWIGFPVFTTIAIISPLAFQFFFGNDWIVAGEMGQIISLMMLFDFISLPFTSLFYIYDKQKLMMYLQIINSLIGIGMLFSGKYFFDSALASVLLFSIGNICFSIACILITYDLSKNNLKL